MKMKCVCKNDFEINGILVGNKGDELEVVDAIPENGEDVSGYCDIRNLTTDEIFWATWNEIEGDGALANVFWLDEFCAEEIK